MVTAMAPRRGSHWPARSSGRVPRIATGSTGTCAATAAAKAPRWKGPSPGVRRERALGKDRGRSARLHRLRQPLRVLDALPGVETLDELHAESAQIDGARSGGRRNSRLATKLKCVGSDGEQHDAVEITRVVRHQHAGRARQMFRGRAT